MTWTAPFDGGSPITGYTVRAYDGATLVATAPAAPHLQGRTVTGLVDGTAYTFTVSATSALGDGAESPPSTPVTPGNSTTPNVEVAAIAVGLAPYHLVFSPDGSTAYATNAGDDTVSVIDVPSGTETATVPVGDNPAGIAVAPDGRALFVANQLGNSVSVVDLTAGPPVVTTTALPASPFGVAVSPDGREVYVTGGVAPGRVYVLDAASGGYTGTAVSVGTFPTGVAVSPTGDRVYATNLFSSFVSVFDAVTHAALGTVAVPSGSSGIAVAADGDTVAVTNQAGGTLTLADVSGPTLTTTVAVGAAPIGVAFAPDGDSVVVTNHDDATVSVVDLTGPAPVVAATISVGAGPRGVAFSPDGERILVANQFGDTASLLEWRAPPVITTPGLPGGTVADAYPSTTIVATDNAGGTFSAPSADLPPGIALEADGTLHGTPTAPGSYPFTVTATNAYGLTGTRDYTVVVAPTPPQALALGVTPAGAGTASAGPAWEVDDTVASGTTVTIVATPGTGYGFAGWTVESGAAALAEPAATTTTFAMPATAVGITAHFSAIVYPITYDLAGGTAGSPANPASFSIESAAITLSNPTRAGYEFAGWAGTGIAGTSTNVTIAPGSTGARSYNATWTALPASIVLHAPAQANQGDTITVRVEAFDTEGGSLGDVTAQSTISSNVAGDVVDGARVTFPHASPHTLTAEWAGLTASTVVEISPAAPAPPTAAPTTQPPVGQLPVTGGSPDTIVVGAALAIGVGVSLLKLRRRSHRV